VTAAEEGGRVPGHFMTGVSFGIDLLRDTNRRSRLALRLDVENVTNTMFVIAQDSAFSPAQYSIPRLGAGITGSLFVEDRDAHFQSLCDYAEAEF